MLENISPTAIFGVTSIAIVTAIASIWDRSSGFLSRLFSFAIVPITIINDGGPTENAFTHFVINKMHPTKMNIGHYFINRFYVRAKKDSELILCKLIPYGTSIYWYGKIPIIVSRPEAKPGTPYPNGDKSANADSNLGFKYIRGTINEKKFMLEFLNYYNNEYIVLDPALDHTQELIITTFTGSNGNNKGNISADNDYAGAKFDSTCTDYKRYETIPYSHNELGKPKRSIDKSIYHPKDLKLIIDEISNWLLLQKWYEEKSIPWKRSYLLTGKPGTGKTLFVKTVAELIYSRIYVFDLATMDNEEFRKFWKQAIGSDYRRIILLEDIDSVFNGRENITNTSMTQGVTFDCLLQMIDGIERSEGNLLFITTNHPETLDPAISGPSADSSDLTSRPGRVDRVVEFKELEYEGSYKITMNILGDSGLNVVELDDIVMFGIGKTPSQLQEVCTRKALEFKFNKDL